MVKWTEVSAYSGMPVEEDAPTNATGAAVSTDVPIVRKKKKMSFLDARTKEYKAHQKRLEASRARREERRKAASKINEGQLDERERGIDSLPRQFLNPDKEVMIVKKGKVIVINKKDQDRYMRQGWELAEEQIDEFKKGTLEFSVGKNSDMMKAKKDLEKVGHKVKVSGSNKLIVTAKPGRTLDREFSDIQNFYDRGVKMKAEQTEETPKTFTQKVQEQIGGFEREIYLAENNIDVIKSVVKNKGAKNLKMKDGKMMVDLFSASAIMNVYNKVNPNNKKKMEKLANGTRADLGKLQRLAMKFA
jgi:hypothetical protein